MIDKEAVKRLYSRGDGISDIARVFGVSKQRIHVIVSGYKNSGRSGRVKKYRGFDKCEACGGQAAHLHHKDFNNANDERANLQPLCTTCHGKVHVGRKYNQKIDTRKRLVGKYKATRQKMTEIVEYYYEYVSSRTNQFDLDVYSKYQIEPEQFTHMKQWYDIKHDKLN